MSESDFSIQAVPQNGDIGVEFGFQPAFSPEEPQTIEGLSADQHQNRLRKIGQFLVHLPRKSYEGLQYAAIAFENNPAHFSKRVAQTSIIAAEVGPFNEIARYAAFGIAENLSGNALVSAAAFGGSTLIIEGVAALATADIFDTAGSTKAFDWINKKLDKFVPKDATMSKTAEAGVALLGGSVVVMAAKQRENPNRTVEQNRKYGLFTAAWLAGVCAVQGAAMSEGIRHPEPQTVGVALLAVGGTIAAAKWAKNKITFNNKDNEGIN